MSSSWRQFIDSNADTLGVSLFFAAMASAFILKAKERTHPITPARAILVLVAGQMVTAASTAAMIGYLGWNGFLAPAIGIVGGLIGIVVMLRIELRGSQIVDAGVDLIAKRTGGKEGGP